MTKNNKLITTSLDGDVKVHDINDFYRGTYHKTGIGYTLENTKGEQFLNMYNGYNGSSDYFLITTNHNSIIVMHNNSQDKKREKDVHVAYKI